MEGLKQKRWQVMKDAPNHCNDWNAASWRSEAKSGDCLGHVPLSDTGICAVVDRFCLERSEKSKRAQHAATGAAWHFLVAQLLGQIPNRSRLAGWSGRDQIHWLVQMQPATGGSFDFGERRVGMDFSGCLENWSFKTKPLAQILEGQESPELSYLGPTLVMRRRPHVECHQYLSTLNQDIFFWYSDFVVSTGGWFPFLLRGLSKSSTSAHPATPQGCDWPSGLWLCQGAKIRTVYTNIHLPKL